MLPMPSLYVPPNKISHTGSLAADGGYHCFFYEQFLDTAKVINDFLIDLAELRIAVGQIVALQDDSPAESRLAIDLAVDFHRGETFILLQQRHGHVERLAGPG